MSFILDALRRADAERERERGQLPDLHARSLSARAAPGSASGGLPWPHVAAALAALLLAGLAAWLLLRGNAPSPPQAAATGAALPASPPAVAAVAGAAPPSPAPTPAVAVAPTLPPPVPTPVARAEPPMPAPAEPPGARTAPAKAAEPLPATAAAPAIPAPRPAAPAEAALPALKVGGVMYAETPENRVLVINDQVLREGEAVQPGLVLEHIGAKSAQLRWKGQVVEVPY